jgi:hypothetical protein
MSGSHTIGCVFSGFLNLNSGSDREAALTRNYPLE